LIFVLSYYLSIFSSKFIKYFLIFFYRKTRFARGSLGGVPQKIRKMLYATRHSKQKQQQKSYKLIRIRMDDNKQIFRRHLGKFPYTLLSRSERSKI